jgi:hypothetical protein
MRERLTSLTTSEQAKNKKSVRLVNPNEISRIGRDVCNEISEINNILGFHVSPHRLILFVADVLSLWLTVT